MTTENRGRGIARAGVAAKLDWPQIGLWTAWAVVLLTLPVTIGWTVLWWQGGFSADYWTLSRAAAHAGTPALYTSTEYGFRWSPLVAWLLLALPPVPIWVALHVATLGLLPWRVALLAGLSYPFVLDATSGNVLIFIAVAAWWALAGNRWATGIYLVLVLLMPRPLMVPVTAWLLWQRPGWRMPFAAMFVLHAGLVTLTGLGVDWLRDLMSSGSEISHFLNWGPSHFIGAAWIPIGLALAAWLTWKGRLGWASLAASPYLFPYYFLFGLLELGDGRQRVHMMGSGLNGRLDHRPNSPLALASLLKGARIAISVARHRPR